MERFGAPCVCEKWAARKVPKWGIGPLGPVDEIPPAPTPTVAVATVNTTDFVQVQTALLILFLYFTFQRSELPCPKTYGGLDPFKHLYVKHMQPYQGGTRWAVGTTKADPRAERLSGDAGAGREWIVVGEVNDDLFDMRTWLALFCGMLPPGPRDPDSPYFLARDKVRPLTYSVALGDFRQFLTNGGCPNPLDYGLHGVRSEAFVTCSGAVSDEAAVIQGGWSSVTSASRYDRLTLYILYRDINIAVFYLLNVGQERKHTSRATLRVFPRTEVWCNRRHGSRDAMHANSPPGKRARKAHDWNKQAQLDTN